MLKNKTDIRLKILFGIYVILLIWIIMFRMDFSVSGIRRVRELNLIPFHYENVQSGDIPVFEAVLNILIFIPLGIYLKMFDFSGKKTVLSGFLLSLAFETCQYVFRLGASDITDIITNTLGTVCGMYLYVLLCIILKDRFKANKLFKITATVMSVIMTAFFLLLLINSVV